VCAVVDVVVVGKECECTSDRRSAKIKRREKELRLREREDINCQKLLELSRVSLFFLLFLVVIVSSSRTVGRSHDRGGSEFIRAK
jgi:hypothetical protein